MAKDSGKTAQLERIYNIPLRREWKKVPKNERGKKAASAIRLFVAKHMKSYDVKISQKVNETIWIRGIQKPPHSMRIKASKDAKGVVRVMLPDETIEAPKKEEKKGRFEKMKETLEKDKGLPLGTGKKEEILKKGKEKKVEAPQEEKPKEDKPKETDKPKEAKETEKKEPEKEKK